MNNANAIERSKETIGYEVLQELKRVSEECEKLAAKTRDRLAPIRSDLSCLDEDISQSTPQQPYPPLFAEMRDALRVIQSSMKSINETVDECEV